MDYYNGIGKRDVISVIKEFDLNFNLGNVLKYIVRAGKKSKATVVEDLEKAIVYIKREISFIKEVEEKQRKAEYPLTPTEAFKPKEAELCALELEKYFLMLKLAREVRSSDPQIREGQSLMIALHKVDKELFNFLSNTDADPFTVDGNIEKFLDVLSPWADSGS